MPILSGTGSNSDVCVLYAQDIADAVSTDLLQRIAPESPVILDYINRVQLQMLRVSRWRFIISPVQRFMTQKGRTDYWVGPAGAGPNTAVETGLNLTNLGPIHQGSVFDRSNFRQLHRTAEPPPLTQMFERDGTPRLNPPKLYRVDASTPNTFNLYPAPDNNNGYQPFPDPPVWNSDTAGGSLANRFYYITTTIVDSNGGESQPSEEARVFVPAGYLITIEPPQLLMATESASGVQYNQWNLYISESTGTETKQNATPLSISNSWTEPVTGPINTGGSAPLTNTLEQVYGYIIEFRYYQAKPQVTSLADALLIPCDYKDIVIAGVGYFVAKFIGSQPDVDYWLPQYNAGLIGMIRDKNLFPRGAEFMLPDIAGIAPLTQSGIETEDVFNFPLSPSS